MQIPFNFGKEIKKMSIDEKYNNKQDEDVEEETSIENNNKRVFQQSEYRYEYCNMIDNIFRIKCDFIISKERLEIIHKLLDLKYYSFFRDFLEEAIIEKVEKDLNSPATIAEMFCAKWLKSWDMNPESTTKTKRKSLQYPVNE
jgi:hypothetical protein